MSVIDGGENPYIKGWRGRRISVVGAAAGSHLAGRVRAADLPGLAEERDLLRFVHALQDSARAIDAVRRLSRAPGAVRTPPFARGWSPLPAIVQWSQAGGLDEAIWLAYLTTFFGRDERRGREPWYATRVLYGGFGEGRVSWARVSADAGWLADLCRRHAGDYARLPRGNHRKNEPRFDVDHPRGLLVSVSSLVRLATKHCGLGTWFGGADVSAEARFDRLMAELGPLVSFGRTGTFDLLVLVGNLGAYELVPPRLYLVGSTGPKNGARRILAGRRRLRDLDDELSAVTRRVGVEIQAMEDALCNWQKAR